MITDKTGLWRVVYIARGVQQAEKIENILQEAGFLVKCKLPMAGSGKTADIEIKALDSEAAEARNYLMEQGY